MGISVSPLPVMLLEYSSRIKELRRSRDTSTQVPVDGLLCAQRHISCVMTCLVSVLTTKRRSRCVNSLGAKVS